VLIKKLTKPTVINPINAVKHPIILARVGRVFKKVYENKKVVKIVPPLRI
jgi:hypothetical protein